MANSKLKAGAKDWAVCPICREKWVDCQHTVQQILDGVFAQGKLAVLEEIISDAGSASTIPMKYIRLLKSQLKEAKK